MKVTALLNKHTSLGAKIVEFAGYQMPISYNGVIQEHLSVRKNVGVFDVSHMGEFILKGEKALDLIQEITSNDASVLEIGDVQYSCMPNNEGGIIDDLLVYRLDEKQCSQGERAYMLVVNAGNIQKDWDWIMQHNAYDVQCKDISDQTGLLAVQGPNAHLVLQKLTEIHVSDIKYYNFVNGTVASIENVLISATGYTGAGGFELYCHNGDLLKLWDALFDAGKDFDIMPVGLGARDTLRLEMGFCLYGNDINDKTSPLEAGLGWITKLNKANFNSKEIFASQKLNGLQKKLVGFKLLDKRVPRQHYQIFNMNDEEIGFVTSGTMSPSLEIPIGLCYINIEESKLGNHFYVMIGNKKFEAEIIKFPVV